MDALFCALNKKEFNRVSTATSVYQIWHTLEVTHEGTKKVKESKINIQRFLKAYSSPQTHRFVNLKMLK